MSWLLCKATAIVFDAEGKAHTRCGLQRDHEDEHVGQWADYATRPRWSGTCAVIDRTPDP